MRLKIREAMLIFEGTKYDKQAAKMLVDAGLYDEETADAVIQELINDSERGIHAFIHSPSWLEKYVKGVARMMIEAAGNGSLPDRLNRVVEFIEGSREIFDQYLTWIKENRTDTTLDDKFIKDMSYQDVVDAVEKIRDELDQKSQDELDNMQFGSSNFELVPIESYREMHNKFGGKATGDGSSDKYAGGGGTAWCHTNSESTYSSWVSNGKYKFYVLANKNWNDIPFDRASNNEDPRDDYGNSLIALLVNTRTGKLDRVTLRCNHVGIKNFSADNAYKTYAELSKIAGFNVQKAVCDDLGIEYIDKSKINLKDYWLKHFDGTAQSVRDIREFLELAEITEAYIPDGVTILRSGAFEKTNLKKIVIPNSVTNIEENVFYDCAQLEEVIMSTNVVVIGSRAFYGCKSLKKISLPDEMEALGIGVFNNCQSLEEIKMPNYLDNLGYSAFSKTAIKEITIPDGITELDHGMFEGCSQLTSVELNGITKLENSVFSGCSSLAHIGGLDNLEQIGEGVFRRCVGLKSIKLPGSLEKIPTDLFTNSGLEVVDLAEGITEIAESAFENTNLKSITIPSTVLRIGARAFASCVNLSEINLSGDHLRMIGSEVFCQTAITSITIPDSVVRIGTSAFSECHELTDVKLPEGEYDEILSWVFDECNALEEIRIPKNVQVIKRYAFSECPKLSKIFIANNEEMTIGRQAFDECASDLTIYSNSDSVHDYCDENEITCTPYVNTEGYQRTRVNESLYQVYWTDDHGYEQVEFEGTYDECNNYIEKAEEELSLIHGDNYPELYLRSKK